ncbi:MAG: Sec-independent protein translocase subunit TatA/TatB [Vulcanimicrobiaceae bacterium]
MVIHPVLAFLSPEIVGIVVILGVLLFGAEKLPKLARSAGQAKKEFLLGQAEADAAAAKAREDALRPHETPPPDKDASGG